MVQALLTNFNPRKHFKNYIVQFFLRGRDEKLTVWHSDIWKKGQDFVLHCTFWELGVTLQVSNMNERLKESAF